MNYWMGKASFSRWLLIADREFESANKLFPLQPNIRSTTNDKER